MLSIDDQECDEGYQKIFGKMALRIDRPERAGSRSSGAGNEWHRWLLRMRPPALAYFGSSHIRRTELGLGTKICSLLKIARAGTRIQRRLSRLQSRSALLRALHLPFLLLAPDCSGEKYLWLVKLDDQDFHVSKINNDIHSYHFLGCSNRPKHRLQASIPISMASEEYEGSRYCNILSEAEAIELFEELTTFINIRLSPPDDTPADDHTVHTSNPPRQHFIIMLTTRCQTWIEDPRVIARPVYEGRRLAEVLFAHSFGSPSKTIRRWFPALFNDLANRFGLDLPRRGARGEAQVAFCRAVAERGRRLRTLAKMALLVEIVVPAMVELWIRMSG
ncbi:hypothetical protein VTL71DRAFT_3270 [Oculimacula yallundae]|uniref:Uncharacterized protein n=1 Tax=Oculimacula yallundae TaxID=86028 RepID=A0ABR4C6Q8_9HELO